MFELANKRILLGLTGSISCYKAADLLRRLIDKGAHVEVVMTEAATHFITPTTMQCLSGHPVFLDTLDNRIDNNMAHINLIRDIDVILVAPTSADFISKLANGVANDLLSVLCLARKCPLIIVPSMNQAMWGNPATKRNITQLLVDGINVFGPANGSQACGDNGYGRMLEVAETIEELSRFFQPKTLLGKKVLITAGPTHESVDPVRVLTNTSSGKTGYSIAQTASAAGAQVILVSGPTALPIPHGVTFLKVKTAQQMYEAVMTYAEKVDIFISVAAVTDWRVKNISSQKLKRTLSDEPSPLFVLEPNRDILNEVAQLTNAPWCVGFAAETEELYKYAQEKRQRKRIPLLVGNIVQNVVGVDTTEFILFDKDGSHSLPPSSKLIAARRLISEIALRLPS